MKGDEVPTATTDLWPDVHEERRELLGFLETLSADQWNAPTLCDRWRVRDVVGHIVGGTEATIPRAIFAMMASGFRINRVVEKDGRRRGSAPIPVLVASYRTAIPRTTYPPGQSPLSMLADITIHQIDIRRPLARVRHVPERRMRLVASYLYPHKFYVGHKLTAGLRLRATDSDWSAGEGPEVHGPIEALALTLSGRFIALDELHGEGAMLLRDRAGAHRCCQPNRAHR
jgi:uncharacterized protein (TIGR03083 family)